MNPDPQEPFNGLSMNDFSYEALQTAQWAELERFTIDVLQRYYEPFGLSVNRTEKRSGADTGSDGSHDGEATFMFANSAQSGFPVGEKGLVSPNLAILISLWVEVKKRSRSNVDHHDLGGTFFRSSLEYVTKIIFVSNRGFTKGFREALNRYALRNGVQFSLIDGKSLIRIAEAVTGRDSVKQGLPRASQSPSDPPLSAELRFSLDPLFRSSGVSKAEIVRGVNEPVFVVLDCKVSSLSPHHPTIRVDVRYQDTSPMKVVPRSGNGQHAVGGGDSFRSVFVMFPDRPCKLSLGLIDLQIVDQNGQKLECKVVEVSGDCSIQGTILPDWIPPSRLKAHRQLEEVINTWLQSGGTQSADILAIAGAGKSHLVRALREAWLGRGAYEVLLDGGNEQAATSTMLAVLGQVFPIPMDEVTDELSGILAEWLRRSGLSERSATSLAHHVCSEAGENGFPFNNSQLGHFMALILAKRSEQHPIILIFEDLHKCLPSSIAMLKALRQSLVRLGSANVFTLFTSREDSVWDDEALRSDWRSAMQQMRVGDNGLELWLESFTAAEASYLIRAAIPAIEELYAEAVIDQVGTTPFGIRESLGLLIERKVLLPDEANGVWRLTDPDELIRALYSQEFRRATHYRLRGLRERYPEWLADFLDSGACLGRSFDPEICERNAGAPSKVSVERALAECRFLEIIRLTPTSPSKIQFDHDLIRQVILADMGSFRQRRIAGGLFERLAAIESPKTLSSLAYQAGLGDDCWTYTIKQANSAGHDGHHLEAVQSLGLALTVTDQSLVTRVFDVQIGRYRPSFDAAIAVADPCSRTGLSPATRDRETAELLVRYIEHLVAVGSGGTPSVDKALTEGEMLAERLRDNVLRAILKMFQGRQEFNRDRPVESLKLHEMAEEMFVSVESTERVNKLRARNLVRLAIAYRSNGEIEKSRQTLLKAMKERRSPDWSLATQVRANFGASFFYIDWDKTRRHWQRAIRIAHQRGLTDRYVHGLIDVASLDLLEDLSESAEMGLEEALILSRDYGLENSELRCLLNLGCLALIRGEAEQALDLLRDAERLGFRHGVGRRLWRVRANVATAYFVLGDVERSLTTDEITLNSMPSLSGDSSLLDVPRSFAGTRLVLAVANIALRAERSKLHKSLLLTIPPSAQQLAHELADKILQNHYDELPALRGRHCKLVNGEPFFLITE